MIASMRLTNFTSTDENLPVLLDTNNFLRNFDIVHRVWRR